MDSSVFQLKLSNWICRENVVSFDVEIEANGAAAFLGAWVANAPADMRSHDICAILSARKVSQGDDFRQWLLTDIEDTENADSLLRISAKCIDMEQLALIVAVVSIRGFRDPM